MSTKDSPASRRAITSRRWWCVSFGLRPIITPLALARPLPSLVRLRINSRSNSASPPRTVSINLPCAAVVRPGVPHRFEARALVGDGTEQIEEVPCRACQLIEARYHEHVVPAEAAH